MGTARLCPKILNILVTMIKNDDEVQDFDAGSNKKWVPLNRSNYKTTIPEYEIDENLISQIIDIPPNENDSLPFLGEWVNISNNQSVEYQKIFKSSHENFIKNTQVLFMRYELFHLCLAELVYESKGKATVNSFILGQISKIHEQLFKVGLKNLANVFESATCLENIYIRNTIMEKENTNTVGSDKETSMKFKNEILKNNSTEKKRRLPYSFTWTCYRLFPILSWFPQYRWRKYLKDDIVAGVTVGVMLIAQGMAYAKLAGLSPEYGLYSSGLPLFIYPLFGTSRHLGIGPVALVSLLVSQVTLSTNNAGHEYSLSEKTSFALLIQKIEIYICE